MQCNTNYTASLENFRFIQLNVLKVYRQMFPDLVLGLSDHTPGLATTLGAVSLGARMIEKHFTDDTNRIGPDHKFSMDPKSWLDMVERTRELENALGCGIRYPRTRPGSSAPTTLSSLPSSCARRLHSTPTCMKATTSWNLTASGYQYPKKNSAPYWTKIAAKRSHCSSTAMVQN